MLLNSLKYYSEVLGINHILQIIPEKLNRPSANISIWKDSSGKGVDLSAVKCDLLFISVLNSSNTNDNASIFYKSHAELFEKMRKAMDLEHLNIKVLEHMRTVEAETFQDLLKMKLTTVVLFKDEPQAREIQSTKNFKFIETYSPQYLSQNPSVKKSCWEDLQKVMKTVGAGRQASH